MAFWVLAESGAEIEIKGLSARASDVIVESAGVWVVYDADKRCYGNVAVLGRDTKSNPL